MSIDAPLSFRERVFRHAPHPLSVGAVRTAIERFEEKGRVQQGDIAECLMFAGTLDVREKVPRQPPAVPRTRLHAARIARLVEPQVREVRVRLFASPKPPFPRSPKKATRWIETQTWSPPRRDERRIEELERTAIGLGKELANLTQGLHTISVKHSSAGTLAYVRPGERWVHNIPVGGPGSTLDVLRAAVEVIGRATGVWEAAVTEHVLTGAALQVPAMTYSVERIPTRLPDGAWATRGQGQLTLNTRDVRFVDLRDAYRRLRRDWPEREPTLTQLEEKTLSRVTAGGGPPQNQHGAKVAFWRLLAQQEGLGEDGWRSIMMRWRRARARSSLGAGVQEIHSPPMKRPRRTKT